VSGNILTKFNNKYIWTKWSCAEFKPTFPESRIFWNME